MEIYSGSTPDPFQEYACRMDASGNILWEKDWGNIYETDQVSKTIKCRNGTYMISGTGLSGNGGGIGDITLCNIDAEGNILFYRYYNFLYNDRGGDIFETSDSCFVISGIAGNTPNNWSPAYLKVDQNGDEIWRRANPTLIDYSPFFTVESPDKGFISLGQTGGYHNSYYAKYDSLGIMVWIKYPFGLGDTIANRPLVVRANNTGTFDIYYGTHYPVAPSPAPQISRLFKHYDFSGNCLFTKEYAQPSLSLFNNQSDSSFWGVANNNGLCILKGDTLFQRVTTLNGSDTLTKWLYHYIQTADGGYVGVGAYSPTQDLRTQFYIVKFGPDGRYQPDEFSESVNAYPNPSTDGNITLTFDVLNDDDVRVDIFTTDGKLVYSDLIFCPANSHTEKSMYILQARTSDSVIRKKLIVGTENN
jgi:hypothetical protein